MKYLITVSAILISSNLFAQFEYPSLSPKGYISQIIGNTKIVVEYERPSVRNRKIFGELVPWNEVWRTGAGHCTKISFDKPVRVGNQPVPAGKYSLFTIPNTDEWVIILNSDTTLYGSYYYDHKKDVARFVVKANQTSRHYEALTIDIDIVPNNAKIYISWANVQVDFNILTSTDEEVLSFIYKELMVGNVHDAGKYASATQYLFFQNTNLYDAIELADRALEIDINESWARRLKWEIYEKLHLFKEALFEIDQQIEHTKNLKYEKEENRIRDIENMENHSKRIKSKLK